MLNFVSSFKGLVVDLEDGNLVKLAEDGTVLRYVVLSKLLLLSLTFLKVR